MHIAHRRRGELVSNLIVGFESVTETLCCATDSS
uniref:Uncharacterized protein n=1 Tax=Anguilla anguilla TaxID=7936 RepID=A0A0E9VV79_ANGAN